MARIRVLIIDDSVVIRKVLTEALAVDAEIEVIGAASDGQKGLEKIDQLHPDLVTLDVEMPGMSGLETLEQIRKRDARLPVIMFSTLTARGAATTLDALSLGASDYVTKPSNTGSVEQTQAKIRSELIPKIKALCVRQGRGQKETVSMPGVRTATERNFSRIDVVAIGTSTGGPNALAQLLPKFTTSFPVPIVVVQHMPPLFTKFLAERLNKLCTLNVHEGTAGSGVTPGNIWIAPGDYHMVVEKNGPSVKLGLNQEPPENSCRPSVDVLFRSVVKTYGANMLSVVLTGMGNDGVRGCELARKSGGQVLVQDEGSSVVWGMPGQVAQAGCADGVFPLSTMADEITRRVKSRRTVGYTA